MFTYTAPRVRVMLSQLLIACLCTITFDMLSNASNIAIAGKATLNNVGGNQYNHSVQVRLQRGRERAVAKRRRKAESGVYSQFREIIHGDLFLREEFSTCYYWKEEPEKEGRTRLRNRFNGNAQKTVYAAEMYNAKKTKVLVVVYKGEDARALWKEDFRAYSSLRDPHSVQLFGINRSEIPALIFCNELIPVNHFFRAGAPSFWSIFYFMHLWNIWKSSNFEDCILVSSFMSYLWVDSSTGMLCGGPRGPYLDGSLETEIMFMVSPNQRFKDLTVFPPTTVELLRDHKTVLRYYSNYEGVADNIVIRAILDCPAWLFQNQDPGVVETPRYLAEDLYPYSHLPYSVMGFQFDTVYAGQMNSGSSLKPVAKWPHEGKSLWSLWKIAGLRDETGLEDGYTRFVLDATQGQVRYCVTPNHDEIRDAWVSQSPREFSARPTPDEARFFIQPPQFVELEEDTDNSSNQDHWSYLVSFFRLCGDFADTRPIYLFVHPPPLSIWHLILWENGCPYYWSFDETGQSRISEDEYWFWGIPALRPSVLGAALARASDLTTPGTIMEWQVARGFDPNTADFARHLGYPELELIEPERREEGIEIVDNGKKEERSWWSWSWAATDDLDVSACPI